MEHTSQGEQSVLPGIDGPLRRHRALLVLGLIILLTASLMLGVRANNEDVATNFTPIAPNVPAQDLNQVPEGLEAAQLTVGGGTFQENVLFIGQNQPTVLTIVNRDDQAYQLQIVPDLVGSTAIAAATSTEIEFTDPDPGVYEAQLLEPNTGQAVAKLTVEVETPAGNP
jgi:hypothetical protein